jgi:hypothetical protein
MPNKVVVEIKTKTDDNGWSIPIELIYDDEKYEVENPVRSMKLFNNAVRYKCTIDGKLLELFNIGDEWWING